MVHASSIIDKVNSVGASTNSEARSELKRGQLQFFGRDLTMIDKRVNNL
jgi:hypothetical protein